MLKRVTVLRRREDVDPRTALEHWRSVHTELVNRVPGVLRYVQRSCIDGFQRGSPIDVLGVGEVWFATKDDAAAAVMTVEWEAVLNDAKTFATLPPAAVCWVEN